ncbi:MAG: dynamin family protein [Prochloraceae cyanobacterium]
MGNGNRLFALDSDLENYKKSLEKLLVRILKTAKKKKDIQAIDTLNNLINSIEKPFMIMVVGEVKSGKSSFINALIEADVCQTDLKPCTDRIQEIYYAEQEFKQEIDRELIEIGKPIEILKDICIVDTPGTNSIINNHQVLTEKFIPNSDLVFFVLLSKALFCQSTWDFLNFIKKEWHSKIIFIIQQSDLLSQEQLKEAISEVKEIAKNKGVNKPYLFATSALLELNNELDRSGFERLREFIKENIKTSQIYRIKLNNATLKTKIIIKDMSKEIKENRAILELERAAINLIKQRFDNGKNRSQEELNLAIDYILQEYSQIHILFEKKLGDELSLLPITQKVFSLNFKKYLNNFTNEYQNYWQIELERIIKERGKNINDSIGQFRKSLTEELATVSLESLKNKKIVGNDLEGTKELLRKIDSQKNIIVKNQELFESLIKAGENGGRLAKVGVSFGFILILLKVIEFISQRSISIGFEFILAGLGMILFLSGLTWKKQKIVSKFKQNFQENKLCLEAELKQELNKKLEVIYDRLEKPFQDFYNDIDRKETDLVSLENFYSNLIIDFEKLDFDLLSLQKYHSN